MPCLPQKPSPRQITVYRRKEIVDVDAEIGIKAGAIIYIYVYGWHDDADEPHINAGAVFQKEINEADDGADEFYILVHRLYLMSHLDAVADYRSRETSSQGVLR